MYKMMSCSGWGASSFTIFGPCSMAWLSFVIVLFLAMVLNRQTKDGILAGTSFNVFGAYGLGIGLCLLLVTLTGSARWGLVAGLAGLALGGFALGLISDTSNE